MHHRGVAVGVGVGVAVELGVAVEVGVGVAVAVGVVVGVAVGVAVAVGVVAELGVGVVIGVGVGVGVRIGGASQTARSGFIWFAISRLATAGALNTGVAEPPSIKATTPVLDTNIILEFVAPLLATVQGIVQKIVGVSTSVSALQGPEDALPR
jgi:hypothetical protein